MQAKCSMKKVKSSFKCVSDGYTLDSLQIYYAGNSSYFVRATVSGKSYLWFDIPGAVYQKYNEMFYTSPAKAKNYLLDQLCFDGYPFSREDFNFVEVGEPISKEALKWLEELAKEVTTG